MAIEIFKDSNIVNVAVASARGERLDSNVVAEADAVIRDLASNPSPNNKYQLAQLVAFGVNEITHKTTNYLENVADVKRVAFGEKAQFKTRLEGIRAFIQAKGATTPRSKVANRAVSLETIAVSARPMINRVELQNGLVAAADVINDAAYQMECAQNKYIEDTLLNAAANWSAPYYGTGAGLVKATLDPMIYHWIRIAGGAAILGDVEEIAKVSELTGFAAATNQKDFADAIMVEHNTNGYIGTYLGAKTIQLVNPLVDGTDNFVFNNKKLYILPTGVDASMRPLKVVFEGDVFSEEQTNIDDLSWEIRLDQYFGAGIAIGDRPYLSVYGDTSN